MKLLTALSAVAFCTAMHYRLPITAVVSALALTVLLREILHDYRRGLCDKRRTAKRTQIRSKAM